MATFHPFPRLPPEIRNLIWRSTVEPRIVEVTLTVVKELPDSDDVVMRLASSTLVPAVLHTCQEARDLKKLYQQELSQVFPVLRTADGDFVQQHPPLLPPLHEQPPYFWLNLDIDILSVGLMPLGLFLNIAPLVKRLRFASEGGADSFFETEQDDLAAFVAVEEIQVVPLGPLPG
ncbi:hypothetical protein PG985_012651 [Apiospora marii]|uniref:2EXR domain-containing protein n=1 Tax=Apiospora marii TaxID=335849 RepID=A0ABR1RER7_9PEZI